MKNYFFKIKKKIIQFYYLKLLRNNFKYCKKIGLKFGENCQFIENPVKAFGSEPWLITLGNHVDVTEGVRFLTHEGAMWCARGINKYYENYDLFEPIVIGNNVLLGMNSIIMPGVTIGDNVIVASGSIVTKDVPSGSIVAGVPAKTISSLNQFMENINNRNLVPTKKMSQEEKNIYLKQKFPEWFK